MVWQQLDKFIKGTESWEAGCYQNIIRRSNVGTTMESPRNEFNSFDLLHELFSYEEIAKWLLEQDQTMIQDRPTFSIAWCNKTVAVCESNHSKYCLIRLKEETRPYPSFLAHPSESTDRAVCLCTDYGHAIVSYYSQHQPEPCLIISYFRLANKQIYSEKHIVALNPSYSSTYYPNSSHIQDIKIFPQMHSCQYCRARGSDVCECSSSIARRNSFASVSFPRKKDPFSLIHWTWTELTPEYSKQHDPSRHFTQTRSAISGSPRSPGKGTQDADKATILPQDIPPTRSKIPKPDKHSGPPQNEQQQQLHNPMTSPEQSDHVLSPYVDPEQYLAPLPSSDPPRKMKQDPNIHQPWRYGVSSSGSASKFESGSGSRGPGSSGHVNPNAPDSSRSSPSSSSSSSLPDSHSRSRSKIPASSSSEQQIHEYLSEIDLIRVDQVPRLTCKYCSQLKYFRRKHDLKRHVKSVHLSNRGFQCLHCDCSFKRKCHLTFHTKAVHEKSIRLECLVCGKVYASASSLKKHVQQNHEES